MLSQLEQYWGWFLGIGVTIIIVLLLVVFVLQTCFLIVGLRAVESKHKDFGDVFVTSILCFVVGLIPCLGCILQWVVIDSRHETGFGNAILAWLIAVIVSWAIAVALLIFAFGIALPFL